MKHGIICDSGLKGWRDFLCNTYSDFESFLSYNATHGVGRLTGLDDPDEDDLLELWERNPLIQGSVEPSDFRVCKANEYTTAQLKQACSNLQRVAQQRWTRDNGAKGVLHSRGRWLTFEVRTGDGRTENVYEGESQRWFGTKQELMRTRNHARRAGQIVTSSIFGGFNYADTVADLHHGNYDPLVEEWELKLEGEFA